MSRHGVAGFAAAALAAVTLAACTTEVGGTAASGPDRGSASATTTPPASGDPARELAQPGECVSGNDPSAVDCAEEHTVEITEVGRFGGEFGDTPPEKATVFEAVFPTCRTVAARYLGNDGYDATTLGAWLMWAGEDDWRRGDRWYRCGVAQLSVDGEAMPRTGSAKGVLAGENLYEFQICSAVQPSRSAPERVPCAEPHVGEAIGVLPMGKPTDPLPSAEEFDAAARPACRTMLAQYLGTGARDDVFASWRWPDQTNWRHGFTNLTCYAETADPVTASLRDIGSAPLPR
ncbi:septum formation family protein [Qaidamihabitans albus]|uniref:septum formation family protein n=1 Tax=Qaidamihabitans albus TaxID=2795733 RepID=UPI0018F278DD|nr:septum formation family protein [Qaidamihabitans albus]